MIVAATEEMGSTIQGISKNIATGNMITQTAVEEAKQVSYKVDVHQGSSRVNESATHLADLSKRLNSLINRFKI